ncbi:hypothetical protein FVR03_23010 [Pontibacter qinzhouensis]|uniref:Addiction module protein n=1 Tax=Pontibacter qinzhouensis TaxID=2603253 RepID=A0A5C8IMX1_9BACT|nr:hypothetical protein [Pontibacter qinzhouensis]TXK22429.1 hypothetical protein FVR03_23010 [Pontibacter qinzhouensis]
MNLQTEKLEIVRMLLNTNDKGLIQEVKALFKSHEADWWDEMSGQQKEVILEGLAQADQGQTVPHEEAVKMFGKWGLR